MAEDLLPTYLGHKASCALTGSRLNLVSNLRLKHNLTLFSVISASAFARGLNLLIFMIFHIGVIDQSKMSLMLL